MFGRAERPPRDPGPCRDELGWRHDVIFTSGASEAVEIVAARARVAGRALGATEHAIVPHAMGRRRPSSRSERTG